MAAAGVSRRARRFVVVGVVFLLVWQLAALGGASRHTQAILGVVGFVLHVVFGKAYSLVPAYFDRELAAPRAPAVHLPLSVAGACALVGWTAGLPGLVGTVGGLLWVGGVVVFLGALAWTVRDNPTGAETGTGEVNAHRERTDRLANAAMIAAGGYLALGAYAVLALTTPLPMPPFIAGGIPVAVHLLAVGAVTTLLFAVGLRLLPRFLVATPPRSLVVLVLGSGVVAPALLVADFRGGVVFRTGAVLEAVAITGFAAAVVALIRRTDRDRVGFYGVLAGVVSGVAGVAIGVHFAVSGVAPGLVPAHLRLNVLGFLGLSIVGVAYQFYPPNAGTLPGCDDRTAAASILLLAGGLWIEVAASAGRHSALSLLGTALGLLGALLFAYVLAGVFRRQSQRGG